MNKLTFTFASAFLLLTACSGKTVDLDPGSTSSETEPWSLCHDWTQSFCGSSYPQANELETIRLMDQISREAMDRMDLACVGILGRVQRPVPANGVDAVATLQAHCAAARDAVAPVLDGVSLGEPVYVLGPVLGCDPDGKNRRDPSTETITVDDHGGAYPLAAAALRLALVDIVDVAADVETVGKMTGDLTQGASKLADVDADCQQTAISKVGTIGDRLTALADATASFQAP